jgi:hypothetical protein
MSLPQKNHVQSVLEPFHSTLAGIVSGAWAKWRSTQSQLQPASSRTRACVVWDAMVERALDAFENDPRVVVVSRFQTHYFLINDSIVLRFKKGDEAGLSRNYPTQEALSFHEPDNDLFGSPAKVEVVYILDSTESEIAQILVVARHGNQVLWTYELSETPAVNVVDLPVEQPAPQRDSRRIVRLKGDRVRKHRDGSKQSGGDG